MTGIGNVTAFVFGARFFGGDRLSVEEHCACIQQSLPSSLPSDSEIIACVRRNLTTTTMEMEMEMQTTVMTQPVQSGGEWLLDDVRFEAVVGSNLNKTAIASAVCGSGNLNVVQSPIASSTSPVVTAATTTADAAAEVSVPSVQSPLHHHSSSAAENNNNTKTVN